VKEHSYYMQQVLDLAKKAEGYTSPNPMVAAMLVSENGEVMAQAYHQKAGNDHAEVALLRQLADIPSQSTLYINLEPCSHYGRTPPCVDKLIEANISRVVIGTLDPNPKVNGQGVAKLKAAGIEVIVGILAEECLELNRKFFYWIKNDRPWITIKIASSLNGKVTYKHKHITGNITQRRVHQLRARHDALLTGSGTIISDNPLLNVRLLDGRNPLKIVLDRRRRCNYEYNVFQRINNQKVFIASTNNPTDDDLPEHIQIIHYAGELESLLSELSKIEISSILVEAGDTLSNAFLEKGLYSEIALFINRELLLGSQERSFYDSSADVKLRLKHTEELDNSDVLLNYRKDILS